MSERKTEFWWASIAGADPEPVEKTEHDGRPCVYTLGCADPFYLDATPCLVALITKARDGRDVLADQLPAYDRLPMRRPIHPDKTLADQAAIAAERAATPRNSKRPFAAIPGWRPASHGWRGPR